MKKVIGIYDREGGYGERLAGYLSAKGRLPFRIVVFTGEEALCGFAGKEEVHILLLHESCMSQRIAELPVLRVLLLTEEEQEERLCLFQREVQPVYKYQSAENIRQRIMDCYEALLPAFSGENQSGKGSGLITIYSPVHHCFKTTLGLLYGQMLAREERVLFVSLEACGGFESAFGLEGGADLSDALYYDRQGRLTERLPGIVRQIGELDVLMPVQYPEDLCEVHMEELMKLFEHIVQEGLYSAIVLDAGEALYQPAELLKGSRRIFVPGREDYMSVVRLEEFERNMRLLGHEDVLQRVEQLQVPCQDGTGRNRVQLEELMWGTMGDYVRGLLPGV